MNCPKCQAEIPEGVKFCPSCGESVIAEAAAKVEEAVAAVEEKVEDKAEEIKDAADDMPSASFDPGAPIAVPKKKVEEKAAAVEETIKETIPEVAPVESVLPEFPQTEPAPAAPVQEPIPAPVAPAPVPVAPVPAAPSAPVELSPQTVAAPVVAAPVSIKGEDTEETVSKEFKPLSVGGAFWMLLLFSIPVVGFISSIILSVSGKKKSRKNLSRAVLIWKVIGLILAMIAFILIYFLVKDLFEALMGGDINGAIDAINELMGL